MKHLRHLIEYGLFRVVLFLFDFLPYKFTCMVARGAANVWWVFDRKRQIVGRDNVIRSGIETDPKKARAIAKKAAHHMAIMRNAVTHEDKHCPWFAKNKKHFTGKLIPFG